MISCVYVSREEERVAVAFSRPVNVRKKMCVKNVVCFTFIFLICVHVGPQSNQTKQFIHVFLFHTFLKTALE